MVRLDSKPWYRFDHSFFTALHRSCPDRLVYVAAEQDGRPVSMDLLLLGRETAYYFLGGTDIEAARSRPNEDRKSTRLNSSHVAISYAVSCLKKQTHHP